MTQQCEQFCPENNEQGRAGLHCAVWTGWADCDGSSTGRGFTVSRTALQMMMGWMEIDYYRLVADGCHQIKVK